MIKVKNIELINGEFYVKGKLTLLQPTEEDLTNIPLEGIEGSYVWFKRYYNNEEYPTMEMYKPIIISDTEEIEVGDYEYNITLKNIDKVESKYNLDIIKRLLATGNIKIYKILALPEHFSKQTLKDIANEKLKDGDEVYIKLNKKEGYPSSFGGPDVYFVNNYNYITIKI